MPDNRIDIAPRFVCPACRGELETRSEAYSCVPCAREYPIVLGIPDFRLKADPYITLKDDHAKGLRIAAECKRRDLRGLLEYYWSITPEVESARVALFVESVLRSAGRCEDILGWLPRRRTGHGPVLEIGCGAGAALKILAGEKDAVVGLDRAFRWLVVAKLWMEAEGLRPLLVCANAEHLPFADGTFGTIVADNVIEHQDTLKEQRRIAAEAMRAVAPGGHVFFSTPNRFAPLPDPHYRVPLLGWLPRGWMPAAVRLVRGKEYVHVRLLGGREFAGLFRAAGAGRVALTPARLAAGAFGPAGRLYRGIMASGMLRTLLRPVAPVYWLAAGRTRSDGR
jgi:SAM-dependent methyltransferase/uncharacterized protein YbaR (Trm112 family)